ncbi:hypothetical protein Rs2_29021 [Raphanus sativus]|nr:hypothetical protein Rs2_29021 [Raphanus sativus]
MVLGALTPIRDLPPWWLVGSMASDVIKRWKAAGNLMYSSGWWSRRQIRREDLGDGVPTLWMVVPFSLVSLRPRFICRPLGRKEICLSWTCGRGDTCEDCDG